ncbi:MAG: cyclic nucleotide-gated ion channel, partial [Hyphomicrobiales bacterium]
MTAKAPSMRSHGGIRWRVYEILEEGVVGGLLARIVARSLVLLIIINVAAVVLQTVETIERAQARLFLAIEIVSIVIFTVEYVLRIWVADLQVPLRHLSPWRARLKYVVQPGAIIDFLAIFPFFLGLFFAVGDWRYLRIFRLVRFLKLARYSPGLRSLIDAVASESRALVATLVIMFGLVLTAAAALFVVEQRVQPEAFGSIQAAMWWAVATLTTVGYGDVVPVTVLGRIIGGVVMVFGLAMFAIPIGIVATAFSQQIHRRDFVVTWGLVARVPLFSTLTAAEISEVMALLYSQVFKTGATITSAGDKASSMFFIVSGLVEVILEKKRVKLEEGAFFGEIGVLEKRARRTATINAVESTKLLVLDADDLHSLMEKQPDIARQIKKIARE